MSRDDPVEKRIIAWLPPTRMIRPSRRHAAVAKALDILRTAESCQDKANIDTSDHPLNLEKL